MSSPLRQPQPFPPFPNRPKIVPERPKAMTCIVGMRCRDGVVLGADMEVSIAGYSKHQESKIRMRVRPGHIPYFFAYASNDILFTKASLDRLRRSISTAEHNGSSLTRAVKDRCKEISAENVGNAERDLTLIWAIRQKEKYRLFHIHNADVAEVPNAVDGTGYYQANGFMQDFYHDNLTVEEGSLLAVYLLKMAKDKSSGVGGPLQIFLLTDKGGYEMLTHQYVTELEEAFVHLHKSLRPLILHYADWNVQGAAFDERFDAFCDSVRGFRRYMNGIYQNKLEKEIATAGEDSDTMDEG